MRSLVFAAVALVSCKAQGPAARVFPAAASVPPVQEIAVTAKGFEPPRIEAAPGQGLVLRFTRKVKETCADAVDVQGDPVRHTLPLDTPVEVKVVAPASGQLAFACPMQGMIHGAIVVVGQ